MAPPALVFGAGGIGTTVDSFTFTWDTPELVSSLLSTLEELDILVLDTAAAYPPGNPRNSEILLGQTGTAEKGFIIDSKVLAILDGPSLTDVTIPKSLDKSLSLLGVSKIRTLYAHFSDPFTPMEVTAETFDREYKAGKFERLGLCNFTVEQLEEYFAVCESKGYVKPAVYQGHYNALVRNHEEQLMPLLRKHNCQYYAYSPLGGGFLTGKVTFSSALEADGNGTTTSPLYRTRWEGKSEMWYYTRVFDKPAVHTALRNFKAAIDAYNAHHASDGIEHDSRTGYGTSPLSLTEASLRWLMHHSALKGELGNAVILGAKRDDQLRGNVALCRKRPLPDTLTRAIEKMWEEVKDVIDERW